jgi:hypothetical protein
MPANPAYKIHTKRCFLSFIYLGKSLGRFNKTSALVRASPTDDVDVK